jgi:hypothetical protein
MAEGGWAAAGQGFEGKEATLRLAGWSRARRVVLLRRRLARELAVAERDDGQLRLSFLEVTPQGERQIYEVAVLVTLLEAEILTWPNSIATAPTARTPSTSSRTTGAGAPSPPRTRSVAG